MKYKLSVIIFSMLLVTFNSKASIEVWNKEGNKVNFYGAMKAANRITDRQQTGEGGYRNWARIGVSGETQITEDIIGYARWEWQAFAGQNPSQETRYAFAGVSTSKYGSFDYGRNDGVLKTIASYTDVLPDLGGEAAAFNDWYALAGRTKAVATYRNNDFFGLVDGVSFALQYADNGDNANTIDDKRYTTDAFGNVTSLGDHSREAFGSNIQWSIFDSGVTVGAAYAQSSGNQGNVKSWGSAVKYNNGDLYLAALYFQSKLNDHDLLRKGSLSDEKIEGIEIIAQYGFDLNVGRLTPTIGYIQHKIDDNHSTPDSYLAKYATASLRYDLNKNFIVFTDYKLNLLNDDDVGAYYNTKNSYTPKKANEYSPGAKDLLVIGFFYQF